MTEQKTITPTIMADELGIQAITLRRWCAAFAAHLSPLANPSPGNARRFTYRDREVLKHVRSLRDQDRSLPEINDQLSDLTFPEIDANQEIDQAHDDQPDDQVTAVTAPQAAPLATADTYAINAVLARVERLERSREPAFMMGFGLGVVVMGILFLLLIGLAVLYGGFR